MALMADAVLATAPRMLAMTTTSAVIGTTVQLVLGGLYEAIAELEPGTVDALTAPPQDEDPPLPGSGAGSGSSSPSRRPLWRQRAVRPAGASGSGTPPWGPPLP